MWKKEDYMWKKEDYKGNPVILYEEKEYKELEDRLVKYEKIMYNIYKILKNNSAEIKEYFLSAVEVLNLSDKFWEEDEM